MVLVVIAIAGICYGIAKLYRWYAKLQQKGLLEPPVDLLDAFKKDKEEENDLDADLTPNRSRYSKAQARQRFKKGKS